MTFGFIKGHAYFECDASKCLETFERQLNFFDAWNEAKQEGWTAKEDVGGWENYCPEHSQPPKANLKKIMGDL